jgi:hypothetical protein
MLAVVLLSIRLVGQESPAPQDKASLLKDLVNQITDTAHSAALAGVKHPFERTVQMDELTPYLANLRMGRQLPADDANRKLYESVLTLMQYSVDKQVGSTPDTKGTTSLAMKGDVPKILGFAVQHGAITQQVNGNTVTFRATPANVLKVLAGVDTKSVLEISDPQCPWCSKVSAAISFDVSRGADAGTLTARKDQVASWSLRAELMNHRDAKRREYYREFQRITGVKAYTDAHNDLMNAFAAQLKDWNVELIERARELDSSYAADPNNLPHATEQFSALLTTALSEADKTKLSDKLEAFVAHYAETLKPLLEQRNKIIDLTNKGLLITADWTVTRDPNVPDLSTITAVLENGFGPARKHDLTVNLAAAFFNSTPKAPVHQFHDFKATGQYDIPLGTFQSYGPFVFSLASRYEFVPNDTLSPGGSITGTSTTPMTAAPHGHLVVGQAKLTIPVKGSGVKIPLSISAANRTELIKEKDVRGNIGITFDLDAIFAQAGKNGK